ncbi:MAG: YceI family protein [Pyrinomonadaceae bacterium]|nr:YceI family protein [Pyrinomonadaceae bacterium]
MLAFTSYWHRMKEYVADFSLNVSYLGQWETPWWESEVDKGPRTRAGFLATTPINRQDFGVSWQDTMDRGGILVSNEIDIAIDVEAVLEDS